jgi:hypothetical protein
MSKYSLEEFTNKLRGSYRPVSGQDGAYWREWSGTFAEVGCPPFRITVEDLFSEFVAQLAIAYYGEVVPFYVFREAADASVKVVLGELGQQGLYNDLDLQTHYSHCVGGLLDQEPLSV